MVRIARVGSHVLSRDLEEGLGHSQKCVHEQVRTGGRAALLGRPDPGVAPGSDFLDHYRSD